MQHTVTTTAQALVSAAPQPALRLEEREFAAPALHKDHEDHDDHEDLLPIFVVIVVFVIVVMGPSVVCRPSSLCNGWDEGHG
jgi:hypothetical protein